MQYKITRPVVTALRLWLGFALFGLCFTPFIPMAIQDYVTWCVLYTAALSFGAVGILLTKYGSSMVAICGGLTIASSAAIQWWVWKQSILEAPIDILYYVMWFWLLLLAFTSLWGWISRSLMNQNGTDPQ